MHCVQNEAGFLIATRRMSTPPRDNVEPIVKIPLVCKTCLHKIISGTLNDKPKKRIARLCYFLLLLNEFPREALAFVEKIIINNCGIELRYAPDRSCVAFQTRLVERQ